MLAQPHTLDEGMQEQGGKRAAGMSTISQTLSQESKKYLKDAKHLNWRALYQKYGPPAIVIALVLLVFWLRSFF